MKSTTMNALSRMKIAIETVLSGTAFLWIVLAAPAFANDDIKALKQFVTTYCVSCHGSELQEADRRFDQLSGRSLDADQHEAWSEILDRLNLGDMPPEDAPDQPTDAQRLEHVERLMRILSSAKEGQHESQTVLRRLTRAEYDAAMRNVLGLEEMLEDPTADFTPDAKTENFTNIGNTMVLSDFLLTRYLEASEQFLSKSRELTRPSSKPRSWTFSAPFCRNMPNPDGQDRDGEYQHLRENSTDRYGYLWLKKLSRGVPQSGRYRIRVKASAINRNYPYNESILNVPREDSLQLAIVAGDTRAGDLATNNPTDRTLAVMDVADDVEQWYETTAWLDRHWQPRLAYPNGPARIKYMRHKLMKQHRDLFASFIKDRIPVFHSMHPDYDRELGPALEQDFLDEQERLKLAGKPYALFGAGHSIHTTEAWLQFYSEYQGPRIRIFEVQLQGPLAADEGTGEGHASHKGNQVASRMFPPDEQTKPVVQQRLIEFATRAWRRPASQEELRPIIDLYSRQRTGKTPQNDALQVCYQAILCSPPFLYHRTKAGPLDSYELASRLSFFLWSTPPDRKLLELAAADRLTQPDVLRAQTERLLNDPRSDAMIASFTDAWLQLSKLGTMPPDRIEHPGYYNERLEDAMRAESRMYIADAIQHDRDVSVLVDSDYAFVNAPLARLYGIDGVTGHALRRVTLKNRKRGGLLGQASVLTASANGIDTSPVLRGVWVMECLLGTPPSPPPPDVEPLEPDIRGATTIREQLAKHRTVATCNSCHRRIDPAGFALESFDEIGRYRQHYQLPGYSRKKGAKIDPSGQLSSGESFDDVGQLKELLAGKLDLITNNVARKLLVHATGRIDDPSDRADILRALQTQSSSDIGFRELIHLVVQSEAFGR